MKFISTVASLFIVFGCCILSAIFELPERYIERDVKVEEMVGTWNLTSDSEADVNTWINYHWDWGIDAPWKTFTLNKDGSCKVEFQSEWLSSSDLATTNVISCTWKLEKEENLSDKISPVLKFKFEYSDKGTSMFSSYLFEENNKMIVWNFIGDPDDFITQDFVKVKQ
ncbi:MAG TPA: hypothetical protein PLT08_16725 [Anaerolineales bacterium]|nr:hypothetical protein [Anaerolineales bacterium]